MKKSKRKILGRKYILTLLGMMFFIFCSFNILAAFCASRIWYPDDPVYIVLKGLADNGLMLAILLFVVGWMAATWFFVRRLIRDMMQEVLEAAGKVAALSEEPIVLSGDMKNIQDELNAVRESAVHNARAAKEAEQRKNDLIIYLAHDLKTPLTSVIGYLTLLENEPQISTQLRAKYTGIALQKAERLEELINEFFDITRFNLTNIELELEKINLSRMLEQICSEFMPILSERGLTWELQIEPDIELVCDTDKLSRVFDNLARNAVNYSYPNTAIQCMLTQKEEEIIVRFKNRGKTISQEKLARIFEQFFRLDASRASSTGGAGLGLAIAKEIVELHGGRIEAESAEESVSFTVHLRALT